MRNEEIECGILSHPSHLLVSHRKGSHPSILYSMSECRFRIYIYRPPPLEEAQQGSDFVFYSLTLRLEIANISHTVDRPAESIDPSILEGLCGENSQMTYSKTHLRTVVCVYEYVCKCVCIYGCTHIGFTGFVLARTSTSQ